MTAIDFLGRRCTNSAVQLALRYHLSVSAAGVVCLTLSHVSARCDWSERSVKCNVKCKCKV